jgi:2-C-methyl-D-erythritol 2,4-cyclodiphosphate synthase
MHLQTGGALASAQGYAIGNVDATVIAQAPKLAPYIDLMRANIAADLACDAAQISVKATTTDALGFIGRDEGIAAMANVLLTGS